TRITVRLNAVGLPPARHWQPCLTNFVELCATKCGATSATRAGQSRSRPSTESPVAGARRRRDRNARAGRRLGFHCAPAGRRNGLIQTLTRFRRRSADRKLLHRGISLPPLSALGQKQTISESVKCCLLYPRKRTKRTSTDATGMSALPRKRTKRRCVWDYR